MPSLLLKSVPLDIRKYLLKIQMDAKIEKGINQYSLETALYKVVRKQMEIDFKKPS